MRTCIVCVLLLLFFVFVFVCSHVHAGNATRVCGEDGEWGEPDVSQCESLTFFYLKQEVHCSYGTCVLISWQCHVM